MHKPADMSIWQGRIDSEEAGDTLRWHQVIKAWDGHSDLNQAITLLGFACDEGVRRNLGRPGARKGPAAIRSALANLAYFQESASHDAGDVLCEEQGLEQAQILLAEQVSKILQHHGFPIILGGGHEVAWGSFLGLASYLESFGSRRRIGIINFDAHFDLRNPQPQPSSGTPFRQMAQWCESANQSFHYMVLGINQSTNTAALFEYARQHNVQWIEDSDWRLNASAEIETSLSKFLDKIDDLYLSICLDVFPANAAPGVSAPSALGVSPMLVIQLINLIRSMCLQQQVELRLCDIAEMNPDFDIDNHTARLAARLIHEIVKEIN